MGDFAYETPRFLINGAFCEGSGEAVTPILDPSTEGELARFRHASRSDVDKAIEAAHRAFATWSRETPYARADILKKAAEIIRDRRDAIAATLTMENGKVIAESRLEVDFSANLFEWLAEEACHSPGRLIPARNSDFRLTVEPEPLGPVACLTPWNFPAVTPVRKFAAALAAGCTVVTKPAEETPATTIALARCLMDAGLPDGVLNVVFGDPGAIATQLIESPFIRKISFTGSVQVGKMLTRQASDHMKRVTMELGGHAPVVVWDDVDPQKAARICAAGKFRNAGQVCTSPTRFYVHEKAYEPFLETFVETARNIRIGSGLDERNGMGPLSNPRRVSAIEDFIADAVEKGAAHHCGGERQANKGYFLTPAVLSDLSDDARILHEEPFGPAAAILRWSDYGEMMERANALELGLASYVFTGHAERAERSARDLQAGMVGINNFVVSQTELPFGGVKDSGYGMEGGTEGLEAFQTKKSVAHQLR